MSYTPDSMVACPNLQARLNDIFTNKAAQFYMQPIPLTEYLMSPINRNGLSMMVAPGSAKLKTVQLVYQPRQLQTDVQTDVSTSSLCTAETERGTTSAEYTIDETSNVFNEQLFNVDTLARACEDNNDYFNEQIMRMIAAADVRVNTKNAVQAAALVGGWSTEVADITNATLSGNDLQLRTLVPSSTFEPFPVSIEALDAATMVSNFGPYAVIGGMQWYQYNRNLRAACCSQYGLDAGEIQALYGSANLYDKAVSTALGGAEFNLVIANGATQLLYWNRAQGLFGERYSGGAQNFGVVVSPATGIPYDVVIKHDCYNISVTVCATTKVVALPADMYQSGDDLEGVNGLAVLEVANP